MTNQDSAAAPPGYFTRFWDVVYVLLVSGLLVGIFSFVPLSLYSSAPPSYDYYNEQAAQRFGSVLRDSGIRHVAVNLRGRGDTRYLEVHVYGGVAGRDRIYSGLVLNHDLGVHRMSLDVDARGVDITAAGLRDPEADALDRERQWEAHAVFIESMLDRMPDEATDEHDRHEGAIAWVRVD